MARHYIEFCPAPPKALSNIHIYEVEAADYEAASALLLARYPSAIILGPVADAPTGHARRD